MGNVGAGNVGYDHIVWNYALNFSRSTAAHAELELVLTDNVPWLTENVACT